MTIWLWIGFLALIFVILAIDLGVFHKEAHVVSSKEAFGWTIVWVTFAMSFNIFIYYGYEYQMFGLGQGAEPAMSGKEAALKYFTGYLVEESLSADNVFVMVMIFNYFKVPPIYQHRVLFWGILGALVMRVAMILGGTYLIHRFSWIIYIFGALLILSALKMLLTKEDALEPEKNTLIRLVRKLFPVTPDYEGEKFFTYIGSKRAITPLFIVLLVIESTDLIFAVDSIPAIFAITTDPFIVFTSNIFAILGLRSLYFVLASVIDKFRYLKSSLVFVLLFIGVKMIISHHVDIPTALSLAVIVVVLTGGVAASLIIKEKNKSDSMS
jgi:tellurite resistance protein TerC